MPCCITEAEGLPGERFENILPSLILYLFHFRSFQSPGGALRAVDTTPDAPVAITSYNIYVPWWTNKTGNFEVMFRAPTAAGKTFGDKINLSNTPNADSTRVEIDSDANSVVVTWWETNQTANTPVMKISTDNGKTFGLLLKLSAKGTIGSSSAGG